MIPRYLMIQKEFQLEVAALIIQKSTVIPPSSMVLLYQLVCNLYKCLHMLIAFVVNNQTRFHVLHSKLSALQTRALVIERDNKRDFFPQLKLIHRSWSWNVGKEPREPPGVRAPTTGVTVRLFVSQRQPAPEPPVPTFLLWPATRHI